MDANISERLPNFFILGARRCGTTTLYELLARHPDIYMSPNKQTCYFSNDMLYMRGADYYANTFFRNAEGHSARGEGTDYYFYDDRVPARIAETLAGYDLHFVVILRDPTLRAYSEYLKAVADGRQELTFEAALERQDPNNASYVKSGQYVGPLRRYFDTFGRDRVLVLLHEDLAADADQLLRQIQRFLGVTELGLVGRELRANRPAVPRSRMLGYVREGVRSAAVAAPPAARDVTRRLVPPHVYLRARRAAGRWYRKPLDVKPMKPTTEHQLRQQFTPEIDELEHILHRDLSHWRAGA